MGRLNQPITHIDIYNIPFNIPLREMTARGTKHHTPIFAGPGKITVSFNVNNRILPENPAKHLIIHASFKV